MKANIIGNIFGADGFTSHVRQLANALHEQGLDVRIDCGKPQGWERVVTDAEYLMLTKEYSEDMTSILIGTPQYLPFVWAENPKHTIMFLIWEGNTIPFSWLNNLLSEKTNQIWVPSIHVKDAILYGAFGTEKDTLNKKIKIISHGVDLSLFNHDLKPIKTENQPFVFLCNKGWRGTEDDRSGIQYLLRAYTEEFTSKDNVRLVCKINPSYLPQSFDFKQAMANLGIEKKEDSPIIMVSTENMPYKMMPEIYKDADVYVNPCRAEGFGLPGLEAHAMGVPSIQTNFGGQTDYMTEYTDFYLNDFTMDEVQNDLQYEGIKWCTPNVKELREKMRYTYENPQEMRKKGQKAFENSYKWTWTETSKKVKEVLNELK